jgi:hypothetical protein
MPVITTTHDLSRVIDLGSDAWSGKVITALDGTGTDTFGTFPIRGKFAIENATSANTKKTEGGNEIEGKVTEKWTLKVTGMQKGIAEILTMPKAIKGKYLLIVLELNNEPVYADNKHLYAAVIGKLTKRPGLTNDGDPEYEFQLYAATDDIIIALDAATFPKFVADLDPSVNLQIDEGEYIGMVEAPAAA